MPFGLSKERLFEILRFGVSSLMMLGIKVALTWIMATGVNAYASYAITHVLLFFFSYVAHLKFTFRVTHSGQRMWDFLKSVILIKILDYALFGVLFKATGDELSLSVLLASVAVTFVRFSQMKKALTGGEPSAPEEIV
jgi:putative flippase GtrA